MDEDSTSRLHQKNNCYLSICPCASGDRGGGGGGAVGSSVLKRAKKSSIFKRFVCPCPLK